MTAFSEDPVPSPSENRPDQARFKGTHLLPVALNAAVPLRVFAMYKRGGPLPADWQHLPAIGHLLAEQGDRLLFRSSRPGETAELFNALAEALAILSFVPGGVLFGDERFDALHILTGLLGEERANAYVAHIRQGSAE